MLFSKWSVHNNDNKKTRFTHLLLNGGKLNVPDEEHKLFLKTYASALDMGKKDLYVVECRRTNPSVFRMMMDFDGIFRTRLGDEDIMRFAHFVQKIITDVYDTDYNVILCRSPPKEKEGGMLKCGYHFIWPRLFVTTEIALSIRQTVLSKLETWDTKPICPENKWEDVIDELVYTRNGFRMVGSDKWNYKRKTGENRPYTLYAVLDNQGEIRKTYMDLLEKNTFRLVQDTSIREIFGHTERTIPIPKLKLMNTPNKVKKLLISHVENSHENHTIVQDFIHEKLPKAYKHVNVKSIRKYPDGNYLIIPDTKYCLNIRREHSSCGIYFLLTQKGLYQKCLCPCINLKGRINGYCKDYTSKCYKFDAMVKEAFFPDTFNKYTFSGTQNRRKQLSKYAKYCDDLFSQI